MDVPQELRLKPGPGAPSRALHQRWCKVPPKGGKHILPVSFSSSHSMQVHNSVSDGKAVQKYTLRCNAHLGQAAGVNFIGRINVL